MAKTGSASRDKKAKEVARGTLRRLAFPRDLRTRRTIQFELPEFLIFALEQRVTEANTDATDLELATLNDYVESELTNLITLRDIAELEAVAPGFSSAVQAWLNEIEP